jgi:hypothetical protein
VVKLGSELVEIRGCCFQQTLAIEMLATHQINSLLSQEGLQTGNIPVGWIQYEASPGDPFPEVPRFCGVYKTLGDRRLADHVLRGLELLLPALFPEVPADRGFGFPAGVFGQRPLDGQAFQEEDTTFMQASCGGLDDPANFLDFMDLKAPRMAAPVSTAAPAHCSAELKCRWEQYCASLGAFLAEHPDSNLLGYLYWRFGWECGAVMRLFRRQSISWGTFRDASGTHCNAHGNNFVLRSPTEKQVTFLAPVDFDFSYTVESCAFSTDRAADAILANENIDMEFSALALDLGGSPHSTGTQNNHAVSERCAALRWALRDTAVKAYVASFRNEADLHPHQPQLSAAVYDLLSLALIQTSNFIA